MKPLLPVEPAYRLAVRPEAQRWLVEQLWGEQAVGLIGGEPKCCKSFLALELAVAVASGRPCLRRFCVPHPGRVLLFAAEDALHVVRQRLAGIADAAGVALEDLDVQVITASRLRLDLNADVERLANTVADLKPRLLVLDPFVRLHRCDENASAEVAPLLDLLRQMQRQHQLAVVLVHHARKGGGNIRAGQALRGSSEFHAWGDSLLYLRRHGDKLALSVEHRAAAGLDGLALRLRTDEGRLALEILEGRPVAEPSPALPVTDRIREVLASASEPVALASLRNSCRLRKATLCQALAELTRGGHVLKTDAGYQLSNA
jgi:hypothetical protein